MAGDGEARLGRRVANKHWGTRRNILLHGGCLDAKAFGIQGNSLRAEKQVLGFRVLGLGFWVSANKGDQCRTSQIESADHEFRGNRKRDEDALGAQNCGVPGSSEHSDP